MRRSAADVAMSTHLALSGSALAFQQPGDLAELPADLLDHVHGGIADRCHRDGRDQERHQAADEESDQHGRVADVEDELAVPICAVTVSTNAAMMASAASAAAPMAKPLPMAAVVLPSSSSESVMARVSSPRPAHFRDAAGVVGNGAVSVDGHRHADRGQQADRGNADAVEPGQADVDTIDDAADRASSGITTDCMPTAKTVIMTVAGPVSPASAIRTIGLDDV